VLAAVAAGKNVLCEKPVALESAQAREMLDAAESAGVIHATDFEGRWLPDRLAVWELVREGFLGQPYLGRVSTTVDLWHPSHHLQSDWMYQREAGGGYLMGASSHDIDFLSTLFGPPEAVCAEVHTTIKERTRDGMPFAVTADDTSTVLLRFADEVVGSVSCTVMGLGIDRRLTELFGSDGAIEIDTTLLKGTSGPLRISTAQAGSERAEIPPSSREVRSGLEIPSRRAGSAIRAMALMLEDWLPAFDGRPTPGVPTLYDGLVTASVIEAAQHSAAGEGWVALDLAR
jgi:predicted dehydrogenase